MIFRTIFTIFLFIISISGFANDAFTLNLNNIKMTMDKMFSYHVENKEFSPLIAKRSLKIFIENFDSEKIYLLKSEIEPFLSLDSNNIQEIISEYQQNKFSKYVQLNHVIQRAIERHQAIREQQIEKLIQNGEESLKKTVTPYHSNYPTSIHDLKERIYNDLLLQLLSNINTRQVTNISSEYIEKVLSYRVKKSKIYEKRYLEGTDHMLTLHILKAMAKSLDAHTGYYSPKEAYEIRANLKKQFSGIGIVLREDFDGIFIANLISGGPAQKSKQITVGDILVQIDHKDIRQNTFEQILELLKGKEGKKITLGIKHHVSDAEIIHIDLIRNKITMDDERLSFSTEPFGEGIIGKINVPSFYDNGGNVTLEKDFKKALQSLKEKGNLKGIVLDFRENSGGFLTQAVKVASLFINGGLIVVSKYAGGEVSYARGVNSQQYFSGPLLILISKASASAAEIVAQALQDYGMALIVGDVRSYGKGSMQYQTLTNENAKAFFKVTVGRYYTASGRSPQIKGVQSDISVPTAFFPYNIGEKYLEFPLSNDHLSDDLFSSLMNIRPGSYSDLSHFTVPYLQPRESEWRKILSNLKMNSKERIANDKNYQFFLKVGNGYRPKLNRKKSRQEFMNENYGKDDLQIKESVEIIKDMVLHESQKPLH